MTSRAYSASLSQSSGRSGWSLIFRHPVRRDEATGRVGLRVRQGLGTRERATAEALCSEMNQLLAEPRFHDSAARSEAERRFDSRIVEIFYYGMTPEPIDFDAIRDSAIPLPRAEVDDYRRVLLLGTTGAGKTTLVRQLIGTDPKGERFPSTSTAKTTVHDTEIVFDPGPWRGVVTFISRDEVLEYLNECISSAVLAAARGAADDDVLRRMTAHVNQRYRFNYVLGNGPSAKLSDFDDDEGDEDPADEGFEVFAPEEAAKIDLDQTNAVLARSLVEVRSLARRLGDQLRADLDASGEQDRRVIEELFEEELDNLLRDDEAFHAISDELMDEIEKRFDLVPEGQLRRTKQGWPLAWEATRPAEQRVEFTRSIARFSSNYAPLFGRLLTPLVSGVRVAGPFVPSWSDEPPKLVILDGEGLGHTPKSSSSVPTGVSRRIEEADAVVLVDNATQPLQAAPVAAMREVISTGNARKLILAFTHFDRIEGDNLPNDSAKARHVLASAENVLAAIGEDLGPFAERALRNRIETARFFLGGIHEPLRSESRADARTIKQLTNLLTAIDEVVARPDTSESRPVYDRMNLVLAIKAAAESFHDSWFPRLGLEVKPGIDKEHWTRVKALTRRLATGMRDEYDSLRPVADLRKELVDRVYVLIQNPVRWKGAEPPDDQKQATYDALADEIARRMLVLATDRIWKQRFGEWQVAYDQHGRGSTFERARIIGDRVYETAAPVPDVTPSPNRNEFLRAVATEVEAAVTKFDAQLA